MQFLEEFKLKFNYLPEARPTIVKIENTLKFFEQVIGDVQKSAQVAPVTDVKNVTDVKPVTNLTRKYDFVGKDSVEFASPTIDKPVLLQSKPIQEVEASPMERSYPESLAYVASVAKEVLAKEKGLKEAIGKAIPVIVDWSFTAHPAFTSLVIFKLNRLFKLNLKLILKFSTSTATQLPLLPQ